MPGPVLYVAVAISAVAAVIVFKEFVYDPHFRPRISAWRDSRQRRRARPHLRSVSSTSSDSEDGSQPPPQRGTLGKGNELKQPAEYSATSQIELRELIASEVESLRSSGEEIDKTSIRFRHKRISRDRRVENPRHTLGPQSTSQPLILLDGPNISKGDPSTRTSDINCRQPKGSIPSSLLSSPTSSHTQNPIQTVQRDETTHIQALRIPERPSTSESVDLLTPTPMGAGPLEPSPLDAAISGPSEVPSVDQYLDPRDQTLSPQSFNGTLSPALSDLLSSPFYSPPASPFIHAATYRESPILPADDSAQRSNTPGGIIPSPGVIENPLPRASPLPVVSADSEVFSLLSQASSDTDSDEGGYDSASMLGSEMSSWASDVAYGDGTTQHT
ncbi:hypothetical protein EDB84DRAFT_1454023 [Lactarius hengduanensis]|nr:hypothetical protein EDB84DRAFT_1454023 [Lactarius hengduanensis]